MPRTRTFYAQVKRLLAKRPSLYRYARVVLNLLRYALRRPHEPDFRYLKKAQLGGLILDVGANNGMSALSIRIFDRETPILSIEPSRLVEPELRLIKWVLPHFDYKIAAAGAHHGELTLFTPCYRGMPITGEATLDRPPRPEEIDWIKNNVVRFQPDDLSLQTQHVPVVPLDSLRLSPTFVKIDVEGGELAVLTGLTETLKRCRPLLLVERSSSYRQIAKFLNSLGYESYSYDSATDDLLPYDDGPILNVFFRWERRSA